MSEIHIFHTGVPLEQCEATIAIYINTSFKVIESKLREELKNIEMINLSQIILSPFEFHLNYFENIFSFSKKQFNMFKNCLNHNRLKPSKGYKKIECKFFFNFQKQ